ncbi:hypothetical protein P7C70_g3477, partial [Phenoliferia sp. Uapishka_3]
MSAPTSLPPSPPHSPPAPAINGNSSAANHSPVPPRNIVLLFDGTANTFSSDVREFGLGLPAEGDADATVATDSQLTNLPVLFSLLSAEPSHQILALARELASRTPREDEPKSLATPRYERPWTPSGLAKIVTRAMDLAVATSLVSRQSLKLQRGDMIVAFTDSSYLGRDTVSSVGALVPKTLPFAQGGRAISHFRHALALDERRARFQPQLWMPDPPEPFTPCTTPLSQFRQKVPSSISSGTTSVKEVWFSGAHGNVGGGHTPTDGDIAPRLSHIPLTWMIREAFDQGLHLALKAVVASPIYQPFLPDVQTLDSSINLSKVDPSGFMIEENLFSSVETLHSPPTILHQLVHLATQSSSRLRDDALSPRGDALDFKIERKPAHSGEHVKTTAARFVQRLITCAWWILEILPALRVVWDVNGEARKWTIGSHFGRGRTLPASACFHESVRIRQQATPGEFAPGDGSNVPETRYEPRASFAKEEHEAALVYSWIQSRNSSSSLESTCLDHAIFSARLISTPSRGDPIISPLPPPVLVHNTVGIYAVSVDPKLVIPKREYTLEVRLEFGWLPQAREGNVCGRNTVACDVSTLLPAVKFVGAKVNVVSGSQVILGQGTTKFDFLKRGFILTNSHLAGTALLVQDEICKELSPISGYWEGVEFHPSNLGQPCRLQKPLLPAIAATTTSAPIWIHLLGDSNIRNLYSTLVTTFGKGTVQSHEVTDSTTRNGTFASVALRSSSQKNSLGSSRDPDVILTWHWWETDSKNFEESAEELAYLAGGTLTEFLSRASLPNALSKYPTLESAAKTLIPTRTYFSLGSHSEALTAFGTSELLDVLLSEECLSMALRTEAKIRIFTTTFVQSAKIPLKQFPHQDIVRNNAVIWGKNEVVRARRELVGRVIDAEGLTWGITET